MDFIAHKNSEGAQSVFEHCENTAETASHFSSDFGAESIGKLQGLLHDCGKLTERFCNYISGNSHDKRGDIDHSYAGAKYICELADEADKKRFFDVSRFIARTIISHHGLHDWIDDNCSDYFEKRVGKNDDYTKIKQNTDQIFGRKKLLLLLEKAEQEYTALRKKIHDFSGSRTEKNEEFAFYLGMLERMSQSVIIDADRIDTAVFMSDEPPEGNVDFGKLWENMHENINLKLQSFSDRTDPISLRRRDISDRCADFAKNDVGVCRLIVPTGGGKTLSSLRFAADYCLGHGMKKIIYAAPFMSILEQNSDVIREVAGSDNFIEHHSNAFADISDKEDIGEYMEYELHSERWDSPVIATTMVQLLDTLFSAKTTCVRRMHRLSRAVIIIDEVQSIPLKCVNLFNLAVNFLTKICGAAVVLCSATQPVMEMTKYPLVIDKKSSMTGEFGEDFKIFHRSDIVSDITPYGFDYDEAVDFCRNKFEEAGNLLVIVNTKAAALNLYKRLNETYGKNTAVVHLSTNMCPQHRKDKINKVRILLENKMSVICVTTQLIEAGVDISFRCVVRSLAGLDNAVQAAGRCNRHGECGDVCSVHIIKIKEENLGSLHDIKDAQSIFQSMLKTGKYIDWQSDEAVSDYFSQLYSMEKSKLSYNIKDCGTDTNILNLLALNRERYSVSPKTMSKFSAQAFRTAGTLFNVIDNCADDVIVPYNDEAEMLIEELKSAEKNVSSLLRKAQKFTVSVYRGTKKKLGENNAVYRLANGTLVLEKRFYDNESGVSTEGSEQELLMF